MFKTMTGTNLVHVPYKTVGQGVTGLIAGQAQVMFTVGPSALPQIQSGRIRGIAVTTLKRTKSLPDLPTVAESGVPGYEAAGWFGLVTTAGTPREVLERLNAEINRILQLAEVKARLVELGADPARTTPDSFLEFIRRDNAKWANLIRDRGLVIDKAQ